MYLKMFGFDEKPFHITPNPRFIFLSKIHKEAFAHLLYGIQQRVGFMSLAGEIGTGKTTVLRTLLEQLEDAEYGVALIFNPCLTALELLQTIHREFGIAFDPEHSKLIELHDSLNRFLLQQRDAGKTVVLVVDEAQNLDPKVLEELRLLSNLETETEKLIQMVLVGQPELEELLQRKDLRQLKQRLAVSYHLKPMDADDTQQYVLHRTRIAGSQNRAIFAPQALRQIFKFTQGTPRLINILCDRALLVAYSRDSQTVTKQDIHAAQKELRQQSSTQRPKLNPAFGLIAVLILVAVGLKLFSVSNSATETPVNEVEVVETQPPVLTPILKAEQQVVRPEQLAALIEQVDNLTSAETGKQAIAQISQSWQQNLPVSLPTISSRNQLKSALGSIGFDLVDIQGTIEDVLRLDAPIILEITLPNIVGKRFLTVYQYRNGQVLTTPKLTKSGWLDLVELEQIWFSKALLPYMNHRSIPLLDKPGKAGKHVTSVQKLLVLLEGVELELSGIYDRSTIAAVTQFQRKMKLAPDGRVGSHTLYWLYRQTGHQVPRLNIEEKL